MRKRAKRTKSTNAEASLDSVGLSKKQQVGAESRPARLNTQIEPRHWGVAVAGVVTLLIAGVAKDE